MEAAARKLLDQGVKEAVLVKRGGKGSLLVTAGSAVEQGIFKTEEVSAVLSLSFMVEKLWPAGVPQQNMLGLSVALSGMSIFSSHVA